MSKGSFLLSQLFEIVFFSGYCRLFYYFPFSSISSIQSIWIILLKPFIHFIFIKLKSKQINKRVLLLSGKEEMTIICSLEHICATDRFDQIGQIWQLVLDFGCINDTESLLCLLLSLYWAFAERLLRICWALLKMESCDIFFRILQI